MSSGIVVFAHGSRVESANEAVRSVASQLAQQLPERLVEPAFLELGEPSLAGAVERLIHRGATEVTVIPYFLTLGTHLERDLPRLVAEVARQHGELPIKATSPLDGHPALLEILKDRADIQ